ncbi:hypothetical protein [Polaribacter sp. Q13]|uniref:hypothetical protein n=1 Tax=Polaribacter sp. Q13 TaxID=2806551 RepID=UPI00193AFF2F|nr:hypothetical protein [Polaribacter sp. Q13]QVY67327.1 hypothetical protein JOP69_08680 [Polaribacter sp. Q13]
MKDIKLHTRCKLIDKYRKIPLLVFFLLFSIPPIFIGLFNSSSYAEGIIVFDLLFLVYALSNLKRKIDLNYKKKYIGIAIILIFSFIFCHSAYIMLVLDYPFNLTKFFVTYIGLIITFLSAWFFGNIIITQSEESINKIVLFLIFFFILNILFSYIGLNLGDGWSPVGLFQEPSHVAIFLAPLLIYSSRKKLKGNIVYLLVFLFWGAIGKNLTIILVVVFSSLFYIVKLRDFILSIVLFIFLGILTLPFMDTEYFTSRINLSSDTTSGSSLVFLKGWDNAIESFTVTDGVGIGYQQLGYSSVLKNNGSAFQALSILNLEELNKYDGGSVSPKIIAEFGVFGIFFILLYVIGFIQLILNLKNKEKRSGVVFLQCCYLGLFFELFFRGAGYFTIGTFLFIAAVTNLKFSINSSNKFK